MIGTGKAERGPGSGLFDYLKESIALLATRDLRVPAAALLVALTVSNIVLLLNLPAPGDAPGPAFTLAGIVRVVALIAISVGMLRLVTESRRSPWRPDGALFLYALTVVLSFAVVTAAAYAIGTRSDPLSLLIQNALGTLILAPFAAWFVAIAVAVPLAVRPGRYLRNFGRWLPHLLFWSLLLVTPLAILHAVINLHLLGSAATGLFWPLAILDGVASTAMALLAMALHAGAYRRIARD